MRDKTVVAGRKDARAHSPGGRVVRIRTEKNGGALKTMGMAFLILLQVSVILTLYLRYVSALWWYFVLSMVLSFVCMVHVLSTEKTGQTKAIWVLFLAAGFTIGFIAYLLSSERIFFGKQSRRYDKIFARAEKYTPDYVVLKGASPQVCGDTAYLHNAGKFPVFANSDIFYFPSGASLFDDVLSEVKKAEKFIFMEFFIVADGVLLKRFCNVLYEKVRQGVDVRLIIDGIGSHGPLAHRTKVEMKAAGVKLYRFNRFLPRFTFALNLRDHRKIIVIDGKTAYTGGCNLADEYVNEKRLHGYWKDNGVRVRGGAVDGFTLTFLRQCEFCSGKSEDYFQFLNRYEHFQSPSVVVPYADGKDYKHHVVKGLYGNIISGAAERLYIMTPYFVPDDDTMNMLTAKALSGVDVRLLLPGVPDKSYVYIVSLANARKLAACGVKVFLMRQSFVHSKVVLNENCVSVGSANLDLRSFYNQFENGVYTDDAAFRLQVETDFERAFSKSDNLNAKAVIYPLFNKILAGLLRLFSPLM